MSTQINDKDFVSVKGLELTLGGLRNLHQPVNMDKRRDVPSVAVAEEFIDGVRSYIYPIGFEMYFKEDSVIGEKEYPKGDYKYMSTEEKPDGEWVPVPKTLAGFSNDLFIPIEEDEYQQLLAEGRLDPNKFYFRLEPEE